MTTKIWAHRGCSSEAPENTLEAFDLAVRQGADGIELDVHLTSDGHVVVLHDERIDRTSNGTGAVSSYTLEELRRFDFSYKFENYSNVKIPTLAEVYDLVSGKGISVNVEIKAGGRPEPLMESELLRLEKEFGMSQQVIYSSFNHNSLLSLKRAIPHARLGLLYMAVLARPWDYARAIGADALHVLFRSMEEDGFTESSHKAGILVHPWTVDEEEAIVWLLREKVDAIITNVPAKAIALRGEERKD